MQALTPQGQQIVNDIAARYRLSTDAVTYMLGCVNNGGGSMAQFYCQELGGGGQWMRGGMTMVGDLFNHGLKATVDNLCNELSNALASHQMYPPPPAGGAAGGRHGWWPGDLGSPSSSGSQNNIRYAFFPQSRRLAVDLGGDISIYDTLDHQISGVSQQQGGNTSLTFSSQYGTVSAINLPLVSGRGTTPPPPSNFAEPPRQQPASPAWAPAPAPAASSGPGASNLSSDTIMDLLEKLGRLREMGVLTEQEFNSKKAELLGRL
ncbi:MAG: SHOCT domain-containing protein [Panacagrimonas sp.]